MLVHVQVQELILHLLVLPRAVMIQFEQPEELVS